MTHKETGTLLFLMAAGQVVDLKAVWMPPLLNAPTLVKDLSPISTMPRLRSQVCTPNGNK